MADISRIVDDLRGFLLSYDQTMTPRVTELARDYASACTEANQRLAKCQRLLQQGLMAEAIHLAQQAPDLLGSIQVLQFADQAAWVDLAKQYDLPIPPDFDETAIEHLQDTITDYSPLRELLRSHRRLALMRAPLSKRLHVLRELAVKDETSPIWSADIGIFETARLDQIKLEAADAKRKQDVFTLAMLNDELIARTWVTPPPKPLVRDVAQTLAHLRQVQKRQTQAELITELHDAFAELDVDKAREIRTRWQLADGQATDRSENPLFHQVEPVFLWLDERDREDEEENRYHQGLADLGAKLDQKASKAELDDLRDSFFQAGRVIPAELDKRYHARIEELTRRSSRRLQWIAVASVLVVLLCCLIAVVIQYNSSKEVAAREMAEKLGKIVESGKGNPTKLVEARKLVDLFSQRQPDLLEHQSISPVIAELSKEEAAEEKRVHAFRTELEEATRAPVSAKEPAALINARILVVTEQEKAGGCQPDNEPQKRSPRRPRGHRYQKSTEARSAPRQAGAAGRNPQEHRP